MATVSVLIPVKNCQQYIHQCVSSVLREKPLEIIVFDDGSTDDTVNVLTGKQSNDIPYDTLVELPLGIKIWRNSVNVGQQVACNKLVELATNDYLMFLDADDYLMPGRINTQYQSMVDKHPITYTNFIVEKFVNRQSVGFQPVETNYHNLLLALLKFEWMPMTGCWMFHRSVFDKIKFDESPRYFHGMHDRKLCLDLLMAGFNPVHVNHPGYIHRCGWSGTQLGDGEHYMEARKNFQDDLFEWIHGIEAMTWKRYNRELEEGRSC